MRLAKMTVSQVEEYFKHHDIVTFIIGSTENHGTHNVLGVDTLIPERIMELIEEKKPELLIAPTLPYGACDSLSKYPGTINLGTDVLYAVLTQIVNSLYIHGARRFMFLNGHGGNISTLDKICIDLSRRGALGAQLNWWLMAWDLNPAWKGGHGGAEETAGVMAVDPSLVHFDQIREMNLVNDLGDELPTSGYKTVSFKGIEIPIPRDVRRFTDNGWIGPDHPGAATEQWGKEMVLACAEYIADFADAFENASLPDNE